MVDNLIGLHLRVGHITRAEARRLLGSEEGKSKDGCLRYMIGGCDGTSNFPGTTGHFLLVCFDENDKLTRAARFAGGRSIRP
jgi:hypothetical protein